MPGRKPRTSRPLIFAAVALCVFLGGTFTQSSATPSPIGSERIPEMFVAGDMENPAFTSEKTVTDSDKLTDGSEKEEPVVTSTPVPTETPIEKAPDAPAASPEAATGVWTAHGSNWMFLTDGTPYTGWLTDTDGKRYFFDAEGILQTGWLVDGDKRYYLDLDGIMQTGDLTIDGKSYHFNEDGSQKGYKPKASKKKAKDKTADKKNTDKKSSKAKDTAKNAADTKATETKKSDDKTTEKKAEENKPKKTVALTFDDGPGSYTGRLLDCLEANNARATFFMVGTEISSFPDEVKRMQELGCELGNHTYSHVDLTKLSREEISSEIAKVDQALVDLTGGGASVVRPPYGSINDNVVASVGTPMIIWSIDTLDWKTQDVQQTVDTVMNEVSDGAVILMHDIYSTTVDAAEILIPRLIEEGYELVTVHELAAAHGVDLKPGIAYGEMNQS